MKIFFLSFLFFVTLSISGQAQQLSPEQRQSLLGELEKLEETVNEKRLSVRSSAVDAFRAASSSPKAAYDFYLRCHKELKFTRAEARESEYRAWREKQESRMKSDEAMTALQIQLQYLVITLRRAEGAKLETLIPEIETFVANIVANVEELGSASRILMEPVNRTIFAEAYELNQSLKLDSWAFAPGNYQEVYNNIIFPFYRAEKPEMLAAAWDKRIQLEKFHTETTREDDKIALTKLEDEKIPRLYWAKSVDLFENGFEDQSVLTMMNILRSQSDHPDASKWIEQLKGLLSTPAAPPEPVAEDPESGS